MSASDGLAAYFGRSRRNAVLTWLLVVVLGVTIVAGAFLDRREPVLFSVVTIAVVAAPVIKFRDPVVVPPWYFVGLVCLPVLWEAFTRIQGGSHGFSRGRNPTTLDTTHER